MAKVLISLEDALLRRVDRAVRERGLTRSAYFGQLARHDLDQQLGPGADPEVHAALARLQELFARAGGVDDSTAIIREERDKRAERFS